MLQSIEKKSLVPLFSQYSYPSLYLNMLRLLNIAFCLVEFEFVAVGHLCWLRWAVCLGCCLESSGGYTVNLRAPDVTHCLRPVSLSLSLLCLALFLLLHPSTFTSLLSVCQHFPSGGVRHGVRVPGLPASANSHCDLQPRHLSSTCQHHSRALLGVYTESARCARGRVFSCCLDRFEL